MVLERPIDRLERLARERDAAEKALEDAVIGSNMRNYWMHLGVAD